MLLSYVVLASLETEDRDFVETLYERYGGYIYARALAILGNAHDAEDAVQELMCKVVAHLHKFHEADPVTVRSQLEIGIRVTAHHVSVSAYRKKARRWARETSLIAETDAETGEETVREIADTENDPTELTIREEEGRAVRDALRTLSPDLRDAVNLVYFSDFSQAEAAKYLEISDSALRNRLFQAKKKLRVILAEVWYGKDGE